ncbi:MULTISPECIES: sensor histidine kinase [unclassified Myroides]|uniref:sensor histidine kinase n=1 Tax=unclassified Myroides TaxID=2642485 RepID=UPI003D2F78EB
MMRWVIFILVGFAMPLLFAQSTVTKRYTTEDGLIANDVRVLLMDSKGILWIGSRAGLSVRQQGKIVIDEEALQRRFTNITSLVEDDQQGIWIGSYGQGVLYRGKTETLLFNESSGLTATRINSLFVSSSKLYIGTSEGISLIDIATKKVIPSPAQNTWDTPSSVSSFYQIGSQVFATTINHGVFRIEEDQLHSVSEEKEVIASFYDKERQTLFLGLKFAIEIHQFDNELPPLKKKVKGTRFFQQVEDQVYWVGATILNEGGGIYAWNGQGIDKRNEEYGIENEELYSLAYDARRKFLYVGSKKQGLFQVDLDSPLRFDPRFGSIEALTLLGDSIYVFGSKGLCIAHQNNSIRTIDKSTFKAYQLQYKQPFIGVTTRENNFFEIEHRIPVEQVQFYKAIANQRSIWVSTNIGLFQLNTQGGIEKYWGIHTYQFDFFQNQLIETDPYGGVRLYKNTAAFQYDYLDRADGAFVPRDIVDMVEVKGKLYLAGALDGLYVFENNRFRSLYQEGVFTENRLKFIAKGKEHELFVATDFGDIYCLDVSGSQPEISYKIEQEKLLGYGITFLHYVDDQLIIGTSKGVTVIDPKGVFLFNKEQGLANYNVKSSAVLNDQLILGTDTGLYTLDLSYFKPKKIAYNLVIDAVKVNESKLDVKKEAISTTKTLDLAYNQNSIFIDFVLLGAKYPYKLKFQYRVKPTEHWMDLEQPSLALNYLNAGVYPIEIKVIDYDSGNEQVETLLVVTIAPPFYYSWWFFSLLGLAVIGFIYFLIHRIKRQQVIRDKQLRYEKKVAELKVLSVRSQLNTHFIFNVLSSFQYFIIAHKEEEALYYLERFASLIRKTLNLSMVEEVSLKEEIDYIQGYFELENMRLDERVTLEVTIDPQLNLHQVMIPPLLLQPFVENSLVHAFPESIVHPKVHLLIYQVNDDVVLEVIDNGIGNQQGCAKPGSHESMGMYLVKERMKMIQAYLEEHLCIEATEGGTRVRLVLKEASR